MSRATITVSGVTPIANDVWYHAAASYDGAAWRLYLNGNLEATSSVNQPTRADSIQRAALGTTLTSTGTATGFFQGLLDEVRAAMAGKGLGTPATRAAIIEGLIREQYMLRQGKDLHATAKAFSLMELLNGLGIPELTKPELTGDWEFKLRSMARAQSSTSSWV